MNKVGSKRLLKLADLLDDVPVKEFNLGRWEGEETECGTVACAVGHACLSSAFEGIYFDWGLPRSEEHDGWDAVEHYFSLSFGDSLKLFSEGAYKNMNKTRPKTVANRIRKFVKEQAA